MGDSDRLLVGQLKGENFDTWKFKVKHLLIGKELWDYVDGTKVKPDDTADAAAKAAYRKKADQAMSVLVLSVGDEYLYLITECQSAAEVWVKLTGHFERDTLTNRIFLKKKYFRMELKDGLPIESHLRSMKELTDRLAAVKAPVSEEDQVAVLLGSLPEQYSTLVTALEARGEDLNLQYVQQALINEEQRKEKSSAITRSHEDTAFAVRKDRYSRTITCYGCGKSGHIRRNCPINRPQQTTNHTASEAVTADRCDGEAFSFCMTKSSRPSHQRWVIDSGATEHMASEKDLFSSYKEITAQQKVCVTDGRSLHAVGVGTIHVRVRRRNTFVTTPISDVLHVPGLQTNLFSVRSAAQKDLIVQFGHSRCWIKDRAGTHSRYGNTY